MAVNNVCRLCLSDKELFWVFDQSLICHGNIKDIIVMTTGVEIMEKDIISQKICRNCFQLTVTMFKFRERAAKTNEYLQDKCKELLMSCEMSMKVSNNPTDNEDEIEQNEKVTSMITKSPVLSNVQIESVGKPVVKDITKLSRRKTHHSVNSIFATYADIKLPSACLRLDLNPTVCINVNEIEQYFQSKNLDTSKDATLSKINEEEMRVVSSIHMAGTSGGEDKDKPRIGVKREIAKLRNSDCEREPLKPAANKEIEESIDSQKVHSKRRRLSSSDSTSEQAPTLMDTLRLEPIANLSVHRCTICYAPYTSSRALEKHSREHFKCQYCRTRFRVLDRKEKHLETCRVKHALNTNLYIQLQRIDYPFKRRDEASSTEESGEDKGNQNRDEAVFENTDGITSEGDTRTGQDIIELSDDEQDSLYPTSSVASVIHTVPSLVPVEQIQQSISSRTGIIKQGINIKDNTLLDSIDTTNNDIKVFRELLNRTINLKLSVTDSSQTELPSNERIVVNASTNTAQLRGLLPQLYAYKIPVDIQEGDFKVTYTENNKQKKRQVTCWDASKAIEIEALNGTSLHGVNLSKRISMSIPLLRPVKMPSEIATLPKILNSDFAANMSRQSGAGHSSDFISNPDQNLQSAQTQSASHRPIQNQSINPQRGSIQTQKTLQQNQNINPQNAQLSSLQTRMTQQQNKNINPQSTQLSSLQTQRTQQQHKNINPQSTLSSSLQTQRTQQQDLNINPQSTQLSSLQTQSTQPQHQNINPQSTQLSSLRTQKTRQQNLKINPQSTQFSSLQTQMTYQQNKNINPQSTQLTPLQTQNTQQQNQKINPQSSQLSSLRTQNTQQKNQITNLHNAQLSSLQTQKTQQQNQMTNLQNAQLSSFQTQKTQQPNLKINPQSTKFSSLQTQRTYQQNKNINPQSTQLTSLQIQNTQQQNQKINPQTTQLSSLQTQKTLPQNQITNLQNAQLSSFQTQKTPQQNQKINTQSTQFSSLQTQRTYQQNKNNNPQSTQLTSLQTQNTQQQNQKINPQSTQLSSLQTQRTQQQNQITNLQNAQLSSLQTQKTQQQNQKINPHSTQFSSLQTQRTYQQNKNINPQSTQLTSLQTEKTQQQNQNINPQNAQRSSLHTQRTHQENQNINSQSTHLSSLQTQGTQQQNSNPQYGKLPHNVSQNLDQNSSRRISPKVLQSLKPLRVQQNLKPPRVQQKVNQNLIQVVPQTMNQSLFQVPPKVVFTTNGSTVSTYHVQSVATLPKPDAPDISGLPYATQKVAASSSNVPSKTIPQNLNKSIGNSLSPLTNGNSSLPNSLDNALYIGVNSSVTNNADPIVNVCRDNILSEKNAVHVPSESIPLDTSVANSGNNDSTAAKRPSIRVKNLRDLK